WRPWIPPELESERTEVFFPRVILEAANNGTSSKDPPGVTSRISRIFVDVGPMTGTACTAHVYPTYSPFRTGAWNGAHGWRRPDPLPGGNPVVECLGRPSVRSARRSVR